jgi:hypothetical protein
MGEAGGLAPYSARHTAHNRPKAIPHEAGV